MSGTEAAASLFGPGDSLSSDPFATLGTDGDQEKSDSTFTEVGTDDSTPSTLESHNFGGLQTQSGNATSAFYPQPATQAYGPSNSYTPARSASRTGEVYGVPSQQADNQTYYGAHLSNNAPYSPPVVHDPYDPSQTLTYTPSSDYKPPTAQASTPSYPGNTVSSYDPHNGYSPSHLTNTSPHPAYGSYVSTTTSGMTTAPPSSYGGSQSSPYASPPHPPPKASFATVPSPPVPSTTQITRPKISNAYDPPFPVTSYSRRNVSGPAKFGQPPIASTHSAYAIYQSTPPPPSVPPPRSPGYSPRHTQASDSSPAHGPGPVTPLTGWAGEANITSPPTRPDHDMNISPKQLQFEHAASQPDHQVCEIQSSIEDSTPAEALSTVEPLIGPDPQRDTIDSEVGVSVPPSEPQSSPATLISQPFPSPGPPSSISPEVNAAQQGPSPGAFMATSPEGSFGVASPSSSRSSLDHMSTRSPQQIPWSSSASPGYALPKSLRRSPELHKGSITRYDYTARARTTSPGADNSANTVNPYAPPRGTISKSKSASVTSLDQMHSQELPSTTSPYQGSPRNARVPNAYIPEATRSPSAVSVRSPDSRQSVKPQLSSYLPPVSESLPQQGPATASGPSYPQSQHKYNIQPSSSHEQVVYGYTPELSPPSEANARPTIAPYAPSPSLMGANDPLGRTSVRVPTVSFGFGGKIVLCFHNESVLNTGFDVALSSRTSTKVQLRSWRKQIPESAQDSGIGFPGPLHADPGPPSTGIMKATSSTQAKTKKVQLVKYLFDRIEEITQGLGYQHSGSAEKRLMEGKLILVKLLKIMVENDGRLLGTPQLDSAVRSALLPRLEGVLSTSDSGANFTLATDATTTYPESSYASTGVDAAPISVTTLRAGALDKIEEFLLRGERRQACHYALDEKLWAHAMVIASSIDKEAWKEAVSEFIRAELGVKGESSFALPGRSDLPPINGRESLRMAYSLFCGQGAVAAQELVPRSSLAQGGNRLPVAASNISTPSLPQFTPRTPNFTIPIAGTKMPAECLSKWTESAAMMILSPLTNDASAALTALGDQLMTNGWLEAAHVCYLLSLQTSPLGGVGNPTARIVLLGSKSPANCATFWRDSDSIIFTEILEYALAIAPVPKGQEPNHGIPHLQAYRLLRAFNAAEEGDLSLASRYCEAVTASLVRGSVYFTPVMLEELKGLVDRLSGVSHSDKASSWMAGKISRPRFDTLGSWLEGGFTKIVTGGSDDPSSPQEDAGKKMDMRSYTGPFAHYNTISSTTSSARSSPAPSFVPAIHGMSPRNDSMAANKVSHGYGTDKPSSVGDTMRMSSPGPMPPQARSANPAVSSFPSIQTELNHSNGYSSGYSPGSDLQTPKPPHHDDKDDEANGQEVTWWSSSSHGDVGRTPTAARFEQVGDGYHGTDSSGYFSPMANQTFTPPPSTPSRQGSLSYQDEDDDDLGLGNNANKKKKEATGIDGRDTKSSHTPVPEEKKKEVTQTPQTQSTGWFSRWWKRENSSGGGPIKASLGEESAFYFDKDLKRWVNKKAGEEAPKPTPPPPPPPRAQTASPAMSGPKPPGAGVNGMVNGSGFDGRPASSVDLTSPPSSKGGMRARSNLAPPGLDSAPPTPTGSRMAFGNGSTPPPGRPRSQASQKKSVRSRYVDVLAQESGA